MKCRGFENEKPTNKPLVQNTIKSLLLTAVITSI